MKALATKIVLALLGFVIVLSYIYNILITAVLSPWTLFLIVSGISTKIKEVREISFVKYSPPYSYPSTYTFLGNCEIDANDLPEKTLKLSAILLFIL